MEVLSIATTSRLKYWRKDMPLLYVMSMGNGYISPAMIWKETIRQHEWGRMKKSQPTHDHESALPYTIMMQIYYLLLK